MKNVAPRTKNCPREARLKQGSAGAIVPRDEAHDVVVAGRIPANRSFSL
jgi:hypothetical protein